MDQTKNKVMTLKDCLSFIKSKTFKITGIIVTDCQNVTSTTKQYFNSQTE